jgi:hypothetical protein
VWIPWNRLAAAFLRASNELSIVICFRLHALSFSSLFAFWFERFCVWRYCYVWILTIGC